VWIDFAGCLAYVEYALILCIPEEDMVTMRASTLNVVLALLLAIVGTAGCKFRPAPPPDLPQADVENELPPPSLNPVKELNIGDVEAVVEIRGTVAEESRIDNVGVEDLETPKKRLTLTRVFVAQPYPAQLWIELSLSDIYGYDPRPVVVRGTVYRQIGDGPEEPIDELNSVIGVRSELVQEKPEIFGPRDLRIDVLGDLPQAPETMLVLVRAQAMLLPSETDLSALDPATITAPPSDTATLRSNPVRIEFTQDGAPVGAGGGI
jgi:hypothetical protein